MLLNLVIMFESFNACKMSSHFCDKCDSCKTSYLQLGRYYLSYTSVALLTTVKCKRNCYLYSRLIFVGQLFSSVDNLF